MQEESEPNETPSFIKSEFHRITKAKRIFPYCAKYVEPIEKIYIEVTTTKFTRKGGSIAVTASPISQKVYHPECYEKMNERVNRLTVLENYDENSRQTTLLEDSQ